VAVGAALTSVFATQLWPQSRESLSDTQAGFFLLLSILGFVRWWVARGGTGSLVVCGAAAGVAVLTRLLHVVPIVLVSVLLAIVAVKRHRLRDLVVFAASAAPFAAFFLWFNWWRFGNPFEYGYGAAMKEGFWGYNPLIGVVLLLLAPGKGVLLFSPTLWLAIPAWKASRGRPERKGLLFAISVFVLVLLVPTPFAHGWHSGWAWAVRFLTPAAALVVATSFTVLRGRGAFLRAALVAGLLVSLGGVLTPIHGFLKVAFSSARASYSVAEVPDDLLQDHVFFQPRYSPLHGSWIYLGASLTGAMASKDPVRVHSPFGWKYDPAVPVPLEGEDAALGHLWYIGLERRFGFPGAPAFMGIVLLISLLGSRLARALRPVRCS
jgi:4-amino-4-deoxy-L-arabinose transferase-like glycosyltransferase